MPVNLRMGNHAEIFYGGELIPPKQLAQRDLRGRDKGMEWEALKKVKKDCEKVLTNGEGFGILTELSARWSLRQRVNEKNT